MNSEAGKRDRVDFTTRIKLGNAPVNGAKEGERRLKDEIVFNSLEIISRVEKLRAGARKGSGKSRSKMDVCSELQSLWTQSLGSKLSFCGLCM